MENECRKIAQSFLLYQNPLYTFSFPIALICGIVVYGICVSMKCSSNSYILQILIPILTIFIVTLSIDFISKSRIDQNKLNHFTKVCSSYLTSKETFENNETDENTKYYQEYLEQSQDQDQDQQYEVQDQQFNENVEHLSNMENNIELSSPLHIVDNLYDSTFEVINPDNTQYALPYHGLETQSLCKIA